MGQDLLWLAALAIIIVIFSEQPRLLSVIKE